MEGLTHLVRAYQAASGRRPGRMAAASWAGSSVMDAEVSGQASPSRTTERRTAGRSSTSRAPTSPDAGTPAPVRFLPHRDANLLVHARRTGLLPAAHRPRASVRATVLRRRGPRRRASPGRGPSATAGSRSPSSRSSSRPTAGRWNASARPGGVPSMTGADRPGGDVGVLCGAPTRPMRRPSAGSWRPPTRGKRRCWAARRARCGPTTTPPCRITRSGSWRPRRHDRGRPRAGAP